MRGLLLLTILILTTYFTDAQQLMLLDRYNGNKIVNDSTVTVFSSDVSLPELTQYFVMKNNTDRTLALFLRKSVNMYNDSTADYYCFGVQCWPGNDSTDIADSIAPGAVDYTFASHVCHVRRFDKPPLIPGLSSITYTIFDNTTFPEPVEASVTVLYHLSGVGIDEQRQTAAKVYPNPTSDYVSIETDEIITGNYKLFIYNSLGALALATEGYMPSDKLTIPVKSLLPGIYFGQLVPAKGQVVAFKFQVIH
jgi:hypothetical protein